MLTLNTDITKINRVGATTANRLKRLGLSTVYDLLLYFPFRYDDFRTLTPIEKLQPGQSVNIVGQIELIQNKRSPRKRMYITEALVKDQTETIKIIWFNQPFIARNLRVGDMVSLAGKVEDDFGGLVMKSPTYEKINLPHPIPPLIRGGNKREGYHTQGLVPNYHLTANITQKQLRFIIKQIINIAGQIKDWLPVEIKNRQKLLFLNQAIKKIHFPANFNDIEQARCRLSYNELFLLQLQSQLIKLELKSSQADTVPFREKATKKFVASLPFILTNDQKKAAWEILKDLAKNKPMARLLEGDVGSGKTVVAVMAMLNTALSKKQSILMVPTEILAQQHFNSINKMLAKTKIKIGLLTRSAKCLNTQDKITKSKLLELIKANDVKIIIGTHALIQEKVEFKNLTLAIIDEQHRFGVEQRKMLVKKSSSPLSLTRRGAGGEVMPHLLSMTATPIPRSLALALYGDLDISIIKQMPKGRKTIITQVVPEKKRAKAYNFISQQIKNNRQVFVICPLIDFSDKLGVKSVKEEFVKLNEQIFPDLAIGFLHGRMKSKEKETVMQNFLAKKIKILVTTSVVEVGVDVPNATIMMIEGADRFGLAQLHQFRGRVGRAEHQSYCFLFTDSIVEKSLKRLQALVDCFDGFALAKMDLKFRGPGEVYGTTQKGFPQFKIATLFDYELMKQARDEATKIINQNPSLTNWPVLKEKIKKRNQTVHLE
jgi:ATP-dependent DNA helicase RecG